MIECASSYVGYRHNERIIACVIVNRDSNEKQDAKSSWQQRDGRLDAIIVHHSNSDANAGPWTSVDTLTRMGCSLYANELSDIKSCMFERFVIVAIPVNYIANYVQKLR